MELPQAAAVVSVARRGWQALTSSQRPLTDAATSISNIWGQLTDAAHGVGSKGSGVVSGACLQALPVVSVVLFAGGA